MINGDMTRKRYCLPELVAGHLPLLMLRAIITLQIRTRCSQATTNEMEHIIIGLVTSLSPFSYPSVPIPTQMQTTRRRCQC